ncbi:MAG: polysaccharide ABC transporter ATP-binding protein [Anaerolineae bacterium]|nr:polysaccharide ABC transporter ATP-binding protein [Candidatus Roseilinea sp.]MDW8448427.1 polysaccharide ABC transporter ATP-binding protein [Anaerolineae bacterium]
MIVIEFENVSKCYQLGAGRSNLREAIAHGVRKLFDSRRSQARQAEPFWAVKDVSFQVEQGEVLGIIGHNGAGKSTLLKLLSRVTLPTSGRIRRRGRMAALIELGAGFHPELSGRENIYLNGAILGLKRREIEAKFDDIVEFAELGPFIDTPIKRYSSGMYVRLAFAVAAHVQADLLLVDEVLSVGDGAFQSKSLARMRELRDNGATIIFVSHQMAAVQSFCSRVLLMDHGRLIMSGKPAEVVERYEQIQEVARRDYFLKANASLIRDGAIQNGAGYAPEADAYEAIWKVELFDGSGHPTNVLQQRGADLIVRCHYCIPRSHSIGVPIFSIQIRRKSDGLVCCSPWTSDPQQSGLCGRGAFEARIRNVMLAPDAYVVEARIYDYLSSRQPVVSDPVPLLVPGDPVPEDGIYAPETVWSPQTPLPVAHERGRLDGS